MFIISEDRKDGFTLTEVIVVIVIIAALAIILIPNMLSLMPDDHNIKYKKAFYTIQEIVNEIAQDCQGLYRSGGQWYTIEEWNEDHPTDKLDADDVLSFCYDNSDNALTIDTEICKRLSTTGDCPTTGNVKNIQTTNGFKWRIDTSGNASNLGKGKPWGNSSGNVVNIFVNLDGKDIVSTDTWAKQHDRGTYLINVTSKGKVAVSSGTDFAKERSYLLDNPTKD